MLVEKEVIAPGTYFYLDKDGQARKLSVTPEDTRYWCTQGSAMLSAGLSVPVPYEHDFDQHPMTAKEKLLNNAGDVKEYRLKSFTDPIRGEVKDALFSVVDVRDSEVRKKIKEGSIKWTSPWFNSFTDGNGKKWNNVISHLALTTRPRVTAQQPFSTVEAALSVATVVRGAQQRTDKSFLAFDGIPGNGSDFCVSRAGLLLKNEPAYPLAFSLYSGVALGGFPPPKKDKGGEKTPPKPGAKAPPKEGGDKPGDDAPPGDAPGAEVPGDPADGIPPLGDQPGDVSMEEVLCDLLRALGVDCEHSGDEGTFKRNLYSAAMKKVHELTDKGMNKQEEPKPGAINKGKPPGAPGMGGAQPNPLVQQEQQPMYMGVSMSAVLSIEDIQKIEDPTMRTIALSMHTENIRLRSEMDSATKSVSAYKDAEIRKASERRSQRVALLCKLSPKAKEGLEAMLASPSMALSMGDTGVVLDPMATTLDILEKSLSSIPMLLTTPSSALSVVAQPTDASEISEEESDKIADDQARRMGCAPRKSA